MFRPISRSVLRAAQSSLSPARTAPGRRFISTEPPHLRSRSWKSSGLRWGIAITGIYYYNTSPVFAEQPQSNLLNPNLDTLEESDDTSSLDALTSRRSRRPEKNAQALHSAIDTVSSENASTSISGEPPVPMGSDGQGVEELEEEAEGEGAFNPETGEINWDCSCLGGMAHGPCGPEFREAFSCFVYSKEEPKGMDCIEKFQGMRDCFQQHPDVYKDELMEDEEIDRELEVQNQELAQQIAGRKTADAEGGRRLLEEPASEHRPEKRAQKQQARPPTDASSSNPPEPSNPRANPPDEKPSAKDGHQAVKEDHSVAPNALSSGLSGEDVIPAAAHDARKVNG